MNYRIFSCLQIRDYTSGGPLGYPTPEVIRGVLDTPSPGEVVGQHIPPPCFKKEEKSADTQKQEMT